MVTQITMSLIHNEHGTYHCTSKYHLHIMRSILIQIFWNMNGTLLCINYIKHVQIMCRFISSTYC